MRIEVGRGLEGAIPDAIAKRIIADVVTPHFKSGDFPGGIEAGVHARQVIRQPQYGGRPQPAAQGQRRPGKPGPAFGTAEPAYALARVGPVNFYRAIQNRTMTVAATPASNRSSEAPAASSAEAAGFVLRLSCLGAACASKSAAASRAAF